MKLKFIALPLFVLSFSSFANDNCKQAYGMMDDLGAILQDTFEFAVGGKSELKDSAVTKEEFIQFKKFNLDTRLNKFNSQYAEFKGLNKPQGFALKASTEITSLSNVISNYLENKSDKGLDDLRTVTQDLHSIYIEIDEMCK